MITPERIEQPTIAGERIALEGFLDYQRATLAMKCAGLDDKSLREASVPPSGLTLLGLVRHMADVERHWFRRILTGETSATPIFYSDEDLDGDFRTSEQDTAEEAFTAWQAEVAAAREAAGGHSLDDQSVGTRANGDRVDLRWILLHMIEEYARHNGHADLIRERIDGVTGD
ncbi:DinB family protein [Streptomyces sp. NPDC021096]|uniref:DinB family protein n=1 Tax=Streptomyces sp. NPDC021096 TaxID=3154792 RepID=UPI0033E5DD17